MDFKKEVNIFRRKVMRGITRNIGSPGLKENTDPDLKIKHILICRPNHRLGNLLLITPLIQEVTKTFPNAKIDLFIKGALGPIVFKNYGRIDRIIALPKKHFNEFFKYVKGWMALKSQSYDIVVNVVKNSSSGRLSAQFSNGKFKFFGDEEAERISDIPDYSHIAKYPVYDFRSYVSKLGYKIPERPVPGLDLRLGNEELETGKKLLKDILKNDKSTICLFTYATGAKCYSNSWWEDFYSHLQQRFGDYNFIEVLPVENISRLSFKIPTFYSRDIREIGSVIAKTEIFIGADSGIMHLASSVQTPTLGLFSGTSPSKYGPYSGKNIGINTRETTMEDILDHIEKILSA